MKTPTAKKTEIPTKPINRNGFAFRAKVGNSTYMDPFTYFFKNTGKTVDNAVADMKTTITNVLKQAGATN